MMCLIDLALHLSRKITKKTSAIAHNEHHVSLNIEAWSKLSLLMTKRFLWHIRMEKPQTSLHKIFAISPISKTRYLYCVSEQLCKRTVKILTSLRGCTGWSESSLFAYVLSTLFSAAGAYMLQQTQYVMQINIRISLFNSSL